MEISIVVCCIDCTGIQRLLQSLYSQRTKPREIIVVMDRDVTNMCYPFVRFIQNKGKGLSAARNTGMEIATSDIVAFIDDDAYADKDWLSCLYGAYIRGADIVGGKVIPLYEGDKKLPDNLNWLIGCTSEDTVRPIGCNFSMRRDVHYTFDESLGKVGGGGRIGEETDVIIRAINHGKKVVYEPKAVVYHKVPLSRMSLQYLLTRAYYEGKSKARIASRDVEMSMLKKYLITYDPFTYGIVLMVLLGFIRGKL